MRAALAGVLAILALAAPSAAQVGSLDDAVRAAGDGWVRFDYASRDGVEVCPRGIRFSDSWLWTNGASRGARDLGCTRGTAEVALEIREGAVRRVVLLGTARSVPEGAEEGRDLSTVGPVEAARYLVSVAASPEGSRPGEDAILAAFLADAPEVWRDIARVARDGSLSEGVRRSALFWLGQEAASAATDGIAAVASDESEEQDVREAAVFALSQRPPEQGVPILIDIARTAEEAETRRAAFFWLAQIEDARVAPFFEEVLLRPR